MYQLTKDTPCFVPFTARLGEMGLYCELVDELNPVSNDISTDDASPKLGHSGQIPFVPFPVRLVEMGWMRA